MAVDASTQEKIHKYMHRARQTLATGKLVMAHEDYIAADYELEPLDYHSARRHLENAEQFVARIERELRQLGVLNE